MCPAMAGQGPNPEGFCMCGCGQRTALSRQSEVRRGYVKGTPMRFLPGHSRRKQDPEYVIDAETGCWIWQRATSRSGYGNVCVDRTYFRAHRVYYERFKGPIPEGLEIDHLCRNRSCVNPEHLEAVTHRVNVHRGRTCNPSLEAWR